MIQKHTAFKRLILFLLIFLLLASVFFLWAFHTEWYESVTGKGHFCSKTYLNGGYMPMTCDENTKIYYLCDSKNGKMNLVITDAHQNEIKRIVTSNHTEVTFTFDKSYGDCTCNEYSTDPDVDATSTVTLYYRKTNLQKLRDDIQDRKEGREFLKKYGNE